MASANVKTGSKLMELDLEGPIAPVFTPFKEDGGLNLDVIPNYVQYLKEMGITKIAVGGTTGEALKMNPRERMQLLEVWIRETRQHHFKVIAQVGGADVPEVLEMAKHAEQSGAHALMVLPQLFYKPRNTIELLEYLKTVSDAAPSLPMIYYHYPAMTGVSVNIKELITLGEQIVPNLKATKGDLTTIQEVSGLLCGAEKKIYLGNHHIATAAFGGFETSIATIHNMFADQAFAILDAVRAEQLMKARAMQTRLNLIMYEITKIGDFQPTMKAAMFMISGIEVGPVRLPQKPLTEHQRNCVRDVLMKHEIRIKGQ